MNLRYIKVFGTVGFVLITIILSFNLFPINIAKADLPPDPPFLNKRVQEEDIFVYMHDSTNPSSDPYDVRSIDVNYDPENDGNGNGIITRFQVDLDLSNGIFRMGDYNNDGRGDALLINTDGNPSDHILIYDYYNDNDLANEFTTDNLIGADMADYDGDGDDELFFILATAFGTKTKFIVKDYIQGDLDWVEFDSFPDSVRSFGCGDWDGDGYTDGWYEYGKTTGNDYRIFMKDLDSQNNDYTIQEWFLSHYDYSFEDKYITVGDLDYDGKDEIYIWVAFVGGEIINGEFYSDGILKFESDGSQEYHYYTALPTGPPFYPEELEIGDYDGDGLDELIILFEDKTLNVYNDLFPPELLNIECYWKDSDEVMTSIQFSQNVYSIDLKDSNNDVYDLNYQGYYEEFYTNENPIALIYDPPYKARLNEDGSFSYIGWTTEEGQSDSNTIGSKSTIAVSGEIGIPSLLFLNLGGAIEKEVRNENYFTTQKTTSRGFSSETRDEPTVVTTNTTYRSFYYEISGGDEDGKVLSIDVPSKPVNTPFKLSDYNKIRGDAPEIIPERTSGDPMSYPEMENEIHSGDPTPVGTDDQYCGFSILYQQGVSESLTNGISLIKGFKGVFVNWGEPEGAYEDYTHTIFAGESTDFDGHLGAIPSLDLYNYYKYTVTAFVRIHPEHKYIILDYQVLDTWGDGWNDENPPDSSKFNILQASADGTTIFPDSGYDSAKLEYEIQALDNADDITPKEYLQYRYQVYTKDTNEFLSSKSKNWGELVPGGGPPDNPHNNGIISFETRSFPYYGPGYKIIIQVRDIGSDVQGNIETILDRTFYIDGSAVSNTINQGEIQYKTYGSTGLSYKANLDWDGSDLDLKLEDPNGNIIDPSVAAGDPDITFISEPTHEEYEVLNPVNGEWTLIIEAVDVPPEGELYSWSVQTYTEEDEVDDTPPTSSSLFGNPYYTDGSSEWLTSHTPITIVAFDTGEISSGVKEIHYNYGDGWFVSSGSSVTFTIPTQCFHTIQWYAVDNDNNIEPMNSHTIYVDNTAPSSTLNLGTPYYTNGILKWITSQTDITLTAVDYPSCEPSGVKEIHYDYGSGWNIVSDDQVVFTIPDECYHLVRWYSVDNLGHSETIQSIEVYVDNTPPTTSLEFGGAYYYDGNNEWINCDTLIYLNATDHPTCKSGVKEIHYTFDTVWNIVPGDKVIFSLPGEGFYNVQWFALDNLDNTEITHARIISVDCTPPETNKTISGKTFGPDNLYVDIPNSFNLTAVDELSGVKDTFYRIWRKGIWNPISGMGYGEPNNFHVYTENFSLEDEGKHYIEFYSVDNVRNKEDVHNQTHIVYDWWTMFHHDQANTGCSLSTIPNYPHVAWKTHLNAKVLSSPAVMYDGKVFVGSMDGKVYCLDADDGGIVWQFLTGGSVRSSPAVVDDKVFVGSTDAKVYCLNASDGKRIWSYLTSGSVFSSPVVVEDRVFVGSNDGYLYCLNATDGDEVWSYHTGCFVFSSPAVADDRVFVGSGDTNVYCLNATNGDEVWRYTTNGVMFSSPAVLDDKVFIGSSGGNVYCLNATDGDEIWRCATFGAMLSSPAVCEDSVFVVSAGGIMHRLNTSDGDMIWTADIGPVSYSSPAVADGKLVVGTLDSRVYCLNTSDGGIIWHYVMGGDVYSSPAVFNGSVFVGCDDGRLYCFSSVDGLPILIENVYAQPEVQEAGGNVNLLCSVYGEDVDVVKVNITRPDGTSMNVTMNLLPDTMYCYTTNGDVVGTYTFVIWAMDEQGNTVVSDEHMFEIVPLPNNPPIADDDTFAVSVNTVLDVEESGVLANDIDPDDGPSNLTCVLDGDVSNGVLGLHDDGSFTYYPNEGFTGSDSFTYQAFDGINVSNEATVTIEVSSDDTGDMNGDTAVNGGDVRYLALYICGDPLYSHLYANGDVNSDGSVNGGDVRYLALYICGDPDYTPLYP